MNFAELVTAANSVLNPRQLTESCHVASVGAALLTEQGNVYLGVCIDTSSGMGFCAEHAAAAAMITAGENRVVKMVAVNRAGKPIPPCGRCREFISQLHDANREAQVLVMEDTIVTLKDLLPYDWKDAAWLPSESMRVEPIVESKKAYLDLLLLADPDEVMLDKYLDQGEMYVLFDGPDAVCEAVVIGREDGALELKNLATEPTCQGKGYASSLVRWLVNAYRDRYEAMYVGTAENGVAFYERLGFTRAYVVNNFFIDNYPEPIFDDGVQCVDMIYLKIELK